MDRMLQNREGYMLRRMIPSASKRLERAGCKRTSDYVFAASASVDRDGGTP